jgi:hypothetical protein
MRATFTKLLLTAAVGLSLAGCFQSAREQVEQTAVDDDALCQKNGGPPGSNGYAACMKDRDVAREGSRARLDRTHRNVTENMLNGR